MALALGLALVLAAGCSRAPVVDFPVAGGRVPTPGAVPASVQRPVRVAPPVLASPPASGSAVVEPGPFTDRLAVTGLRVEPGDHPRLTGRLEVTTDVSELMVLEIVADFYDERGHLVGSAAQAVRGHSIGGAPHVDEEGHGREVVAIDVAAEAPFPRRAVAAVVTVPQLVNE